MTNQKAIQYLLDIWAMTAGFGDGTGLQGALELAIAALEQQEKTYFAERLDLLSQMELLRLRAEKAEDDRDKWKK